VTVERPNTRAIWTANAPAWIELSRAGYDVFRDLVNTPAFLKMLPSVQGLRCLDLGCGEGHNTRLLAARGAEVVALDIADVFIAAAVNADPGRDIAYVLGDGAVLPFRTATFDVVTAFMSLMDVADPEGTLCEVARVLRPGGSVQFSVLHPVSSTPVRRWVNDAAGRREALAIGGYFNEGPVTESWTFSAAPLETQARHRPFAMTYARRTVAGWFNAVIDAGFAVQEIAEPHADETTAAEHPEVADTRIVPYSLIVRAARL
jgi:ubiquinone/menaquinone biosynthesis C-methylase UbiE